VPTLTRAEIRVVHLEMVRPFRTSFGEVREREIVVLDAAYGDRRFFGEAAALAAPVYNAEYTVDVVECLRSHLLPRVLGRVVDTPEELVALLAPVRGHEMAKSAVVGAWMAAWADEQGVSLADLIGAQRDYVDCGISLGIYPSIDQLLAAVQTSLDDGFARVKLKIEPGWDVGVVAQVRSSFPGAMLTVDANASYRREHIEHLAKLDEFGLAYIEQPLPEDDLVGHALLQQRISTDVCLDESIVSSGNLQAAIELGAVRVVNLKVGRVGGVWETKALHDICLSAGIPVWCGGLMESAIGQAECLVVAALPGFAFPADIGPSERYFTRDLSTIGPLVDGRIAVPRRVGQPIAVDETFIESATVESVEVGSRV
jgi:O-succinylbenzoate synthase